MLHPAHKMNGCLMTSSFRYGLRRFSKLPDKQPVSFGSILIFCPARGPKESIALSIAIPVTVADRRYRITNLWGHTR
jgi:hypothetical protein